MSSATPLIGRPRWLQARDDGRQARRNGEPRDPTPYLSRYGDGPSLRSPEGAWLDGYDEVDDELAFEQSRPRFIGEVEWSPVKRAAGRDDPDSTPG
jgi:hypothetical protein